MNDHTSAGPDGMTASVNERLLVRIIVGFTALLYATTLRFGFVYDDQLQIVANPLVHHWRFVPAYFTRHVWDNLDPFATASYYRPVNILWFRINDALFGLRPTAWHATTILLHVVAVWLAYVLARRLSGKVLVAAFTAVLFALHPMRHEVVSWVSGSTESLWSVLFLFAFLAYLKSRDGIRWMIVSCFLYATALLAKETAIVLPAVVFAHAAIYEERGYEAGQGKLGRRLLRAVKTAAIYAPAAIAYVGMRVVVLRSFSNAHGTLSLRSFAFTLPSVLLFYAKQWFLPFQFAETYGLPIWSRFDIAHVLLPVIVLLAIATLVWFSRDSLGKREVMFAAAWAMTLLLPPLDLFALPAGDLVHDRYFYLSSWGVCLLLGLAMEKWLRGAVSAGLPRKWLAATLCVVALLSYDTVKAASYWSSDYRLFEHAYQVAPRSFIARNNYADELVSAGNYSAAIPIVEGLLAEQPDKSEPNFALGRIFYQLRQFSSAEQYLRRAQQLDPGVSMPYLYLGLTYFKMGRLPDAETNMRRALSAQPDEPLLASLHFSLATVLVAEGKCNEAAVEFRNALDLQPTLPHVQDQMNNCGKPEVHN